MKRNAFHLSVTTFAQELQRNRGSKPKHKEPASHFHITGSQSGRAGTAHHAALKETSI